MELGLELSCPEAARILLNFPAKSMIEVEVSGGDAPEYDREIMEILLASRAEALGILEQTPLPQALQLLLLYAYRVQDQLDGGEAVPFDGEKELAFARQMAQTGSADELRDFYLSLELLTQRWETRLRHPQPLPHWPMEIRRLAQYAIERYWLQAVSDFDLICRVKMIRRECGCHSRCRLHKSRPDGREAPGAAGNLTLGHGLRPCPNHLPIHFCVEFLR